MYPCPGILTTKNATVSARETLKMKMGADHPPNLDPPIALHSISDNPQFLISHTHAHMYAHVLATPRQDKPFPSSGLWQTLMSLLPPGCLCISQDSPLKVFAGHPAESPGCFPNCPLSLTEAGQGHEPVVTYPSQHRV